jgi:hypothetical protein
VSKSKLVMLGLAFAALVVSLVALVATRQPEQTWRLPDGSALRLLKITSGTNHHFRYGHRVQDLLYPLVPDRYRTNYSFQVETLSTAPQDTLVVWMERTAPPGVQLMMGIKAGRLPRLSDFSFTVADSYGVESQTAPALPLIALTNSTHLVALELPDVPPRERALRLRLYPKTFTPAGFSRSLIGDKPPSVEIVLVNPFYRNSPVWSAEPMPARRLSYGVEIELEKLETGYRVPGSSIRNHSRARFAVREDGKPTRDWTLARMALTSPSGKVIHVSSIWNYWDYWDYDLVRFPGVLWLSESAWKVQADFLRIGSFPTDLWTIRGIPVPVPGQTIELNALTNQHGANLRLASIQSDRASGEIHLDFVAPFYLNLVEAKDDQGRAIASSGWRSDPLPNKGGANPPANSHLPNRRLSFVPLVKDAKMLNATIGARRLISVEFCVRPILAGDDIDAAKPETRSASGERTPE